VFFEICETGEMRTVLYVPSTFVRDRLRTHFRDLIDTHFYDVRVGRAPEQPKEDKTLYITKIDVNPIEPKRCLPTYCPKSSVDNLLSSMPDNNNAQSDPVEDVPIHNVRKCAKESETSKTTDELKSNGNESIHRNKNSRIIAKPDSLDKVGCADVTVHKGREVIKKSSFLIKRRLPINASETTDDLFNRIPVRGAHIRSVMVVDRILIKEPRLNEFIAPIRVKKRSTKIKTKNDHLREHTYQAINDVDELIVPTHFDTLIRFGDRTIYSEKNPCYKKKVLAETKRVFTEANFDPPYTGFTLRKSVFGTNVL
jgi:hypothetical protein